MAMCIKLELNLLINFNFLFMTTRILRVNYAKVPIKNLR